MYQIWPFVIILIIIIMSFALLGMQLFGGLFCTSELTRGIVFEGGNAGMSPVIVLARSKGNKVYKTLNMPIACEQVANATTPHLLRIFHSSSR